MAIKVGNASVESTFKMYKGVAAFNIVAVNPTSKELGLLQGREIDTDIEYKGTTDDGKATMRVVFYGKTNKESKVNNGIELLLPISFTLTKNFKQSADGKFLVIDKYGRTGWAFQEEIDAKSTMFTKKNGEKYKANIDKDYRKAYIGEDILIDFLIQWLNIPNPATYNKDTNTWTIKKDASDSEISLDMDKVFKGDMSELKEVIEIAKAFLVKGAVGIKTTDEGKQYHNVFTRKFVKNAVTDYSKLDAAITEFQANGGGVGVEYDINHLHENVVEATDFNNTETSNPEDMPFDGPAPSGGTPWD